MVPVDEEPLCGQAITITITNITISYYKLLQAITSYVGNYIVIYYLYILYHEREFLTHQQKLTRSDLKRPA